MTAARARIGFVLVSHACPEQTILLCRRLAEQFGDAPIALHHDFGQCALERRLLPGCVRLVEPWLATGWGVFPVVEANLAALRLLAETADPDWAVSLSAADSPVMAAAGVVAALASAPFDAFLDHREIVYRRLEHDYSRVEAAGFRDPGWPVIAYHRYVAPGQDPRWPAWAARWAKRLMRAGGRPAERLLTPFTPSFRPYGGDAWYTVSRRAAAVLLEQGPRVERLRRHYRRRPVPEESFYHTLLCNAGLRISPESLRYADWSAGGSHPRLLGREDIPALVASGAHFARKFPFDPALFEELDRAVAAKAVAAHLAAAKTVAAKTAAGAGASRARAAEDGLDAIPEGSPDPGARAASMHAGAPHPSLAAPRPALDLDLRHG